MNQKKASLKVCFFGTYRASYSRNVLMIAGLQAIGVDVVVCHVPFWGGEDDRTKVASGKWASWAFIKRIVSTYTQLLSKYRALAKDYDVMVVGHPAQLDVFLARLLTWIDRKPLVMDFFMSVYHVVVERGIKDKSPISAALLRLLESAGCRLPNLLLCDTADHGQWLHETHGVSLSKFRVLPIGADEHVFKPIEVAKADDGKFRVMYYGTYIPNHGVHTIIEAANLLKDRADISFQLVGEGPTKAEVLALATRYNLNNVEFVGWVEEKHLPEMVAQVDVLLGAFGLTRQSRVTVHNKIYQGLAMAKPIITGDAPTIQTALPHGVYVYLVERANAEALVAGILALQADSALRQKLSQQGLQHFQQHYTIPHLGACMKAHLLELVM